jgi:SAM-dependent methyltransferase
MTESTHRAPTAAEYSWLVGFEGDWRDTWWTDDFLQLVARRLHLSEARAAVDVGSGVGHWGRRLLPYLHPEATLTGIDREADFAAQATATAEARGIAARASYRQGLAEALPLPDASADFVTCQTLLMHVADPAKAIAEMVRVLRPGGLLLAAEPNNFGEKATGWTAAPGFTRAEKLALIELEAICQDGKRAQGRGDSSIGERLPELLHAAGLADVRACQSEQCSLLVPPYESAADREGIRQMLKWIDAGVWLGTGGRRAETEACYLAGGGDPARFEALWALAMRDAQVWKETVLSRRVTGTRGITFYLVSARKRA